MKKKVSKRERNAYYISNTHTSVRTRLYGLFVYDFYGLLKDAAQFEVVVHILHNPPDFLKWRNFIACPNCCGEAKRLKKNVCETKNEKSFIMNNHPLAQLSTASEDDEEDEDERTRRKKKRKLTPK